MAFARIRLKRAGRRTLFLLAGGLLLVLSASAAAAYFTAGVQALLGSRMAVYGPDCTVRDTVTIKRDDGARWLREFIAVEGANGPARVKTALRVARNTAHQTEGHPAADLVLVVVLDSNGPTERAHMRGPALGAEVIYETAHSTDGEHDGTYTASYVAAAPTAAGFFYGERVSMTTDAVANVMARMNDSYGCAAEEPAGSGEGHGQGEGGEGGGHGEAAAPAPSHH